jgi:hypothetical protein
MLKQRGLSKTDAQLAKQLRPSTGWKMDRVELTTDAIGQLSRVAISYEKTTSVIVDQEPVETHPPMDVQAGLTL